MNGRILTSPSPSKVIKATESPKVNVEHHTLAKTMNENQLRVLQTTIEKSTTKNYSRQFLSGAKTAFDDFLNPI